MMTTPEAAEEAYLHRIKHPAKRLWIAVWLIIWIPTIFSFISAFVPWAFKDIAPYRRLYATPFKNCVEDTASPLNYEQCQDNDYTESNSVSGGNHQCRLFIIATIVFVFGTFLFGVVTLLVTPYVIWKVYAKPYIVTSIVLTLLLIEFSVSLVAWIMWVMYAGITCAPNSPLFPIASYSYGFILVVFANFFALCALILGYWALTKMLTFHVNIAERFFAMDGVDMEAINPTPIPAPAPYVQLPSNGPGYVELRSEASAPPPIQYAQVPNPPVYTVGIQ